MIQRYKGSQPKPTKLPKPCKQCGSIGHTAFNCPKKPKKPLTQNKGLSRSTKPMRKLGRIGKALVAQSAQFRKDHPGSQQCFYCEYIGIIALIDDYNVEHPYSKARHPDMRFDYDKLIVACNAHNKEKCSLDIEEYLHILDEQKLRRKNGWY